MERSFIYSALEESFTVQFFELNLFWEINVVNYYKRLAYLLERDTDLSN